MALHKKAIFEFLEKKHEQYNNLSFIDSDPISIPHQYSKKEDIEIAGFLTATISWGQRTTIIKNANHLMECMDHSPYEFIIGHGEKELIPFSAFKHRTFNGIDCVYFIKALKNIYIKHEGLETVFSKNSGNINESLQNGIEKFKEVFFELPYPTRTLKHISNPLKNSSSKRINMYLRWMVRKDEKGVDFGIWKKIKPHQLFCPLDIHSGNVARKLSLLKNKQNDWKAVEELTSNLRTFDSNDPVKYDFALFGLGVFEKF